MIRRVLHLWVRPASWSIAIPGLGRRDPQLYHGTALYIVCTAVRYSCRPVHCYSRLRYSVRITPYSCMSSGCFRCGHDWIVPMCASLITPLSSRFSANCSQARAAVRSSGSMRPTMPRGSLSLRMLLLGSGRRTGIPLLARSSSSTSECVRWCPRPAVHQHLCSGCHLVDRRLRLLWPRCLRLRLGCGASRPWSPPASRRRCDRRCHATVGEHAVVSIRHER